MNATPDPVEDPLRAAVRGLTLVGALLAYAGLAGYAIWETWSASSAAPSIPQVQEAALGALAVVLGAGYASVLGVPPRTNGAITGTNWQKIKSWVQIVLLERTLLGAGVILYLLVGAAMCLTYAFNEAQTPSIVKTISVGFGGYVIAYLGAAYQRFGTK